MPELADAGGTSTVAGSSMLASLTARLSGQNAGSSVVTPVPAVQSGLSASLNPSGLRLGSTLPMLPSGGPTSLGPTHAPFARALAER